MRCLLELSLELLLAGLKQAVIQAELVDENASLRMNSAVRPVVGRGWVKNDLQILLLIH